MAYLKVLYEIKEIKYQLDNLTEVQNKSKENGLAIDQNMFYKKVEDGILDNFDNANSEQKGNILLNYYFTYYNEFNVNRHLIISEINRRGRNKKIESLGL